jgi:uncharacterized membrane protein HdeD (DUF308 family)
LTIGPVGQADALSVLGLAALIVPLIASFFATAFLGWLFLIAGIVRLVAVLRTRQAPGFGWSLLSALVAVIAGGVLLWNPLQGLVTLTYVLTAFSLSTAFLSSSSPSPVAVSYRENGSG